MTTAELSRVVLPYARRAVIEARPAVIDAIGGAGWVLLWPAWKVLTGPLLPLLVRIAIELAVGLLAPQLVPLLALINALIAYLTSTAVPVETRNFLIALAAVIETPRASLLPSVQTALAEPISPRTEIDPTNLIPVAPAPPAPAEGDPA